LTLQSDHTKHFHKPTVNQFTVKCLQAKFHNTSLKYLFFLLIIPPPPSSTLFPYTTLFRSPRDCARVEAGTDSFRLPAGSSDRHRSEEHTSELQSRENLVCRLLLEKKKKGKNRS